MTQHTKLLPELINYIQAALDETSLRTAIANTSIEGTSSGGKDHEAIFTREYLCPTIRSFFHEKAKEQMGLTNEQIDQGLGTEGFTKCEGYSFSPAKMTKYILGKGDLSQSMPPLDWLTTGPDSIRDYQPCPDFALYDPLPRVVGEVKYFRSGNEEKALKDFYAVVKEIVFYLGAFHGIYEAAIIVIADASPERALHKMLEILKPELLGRFGTDTGIYLSILRI